MQNCCHRVTWRRYVVSKAWVRHGGCLWWHVVSIIPKPQNFVRFHETSSKKISHLKLKAVYNSSAKMMITLLFQLNVKQFCPSNSDANQILTFAEDWFDLDPRWYLWYGWCWSLAASLAIHASLWYHRSLVRRFEYFDSGSTPGGSSTSARPLHHFFHTLSAVKVLFSIDLRSWCSFA